MSEIPSPKAPSQETDSPNSSAENQISADVTTSLNFDFAPAWARDDSGVKVVQLSQKRRQHSAFDDELSSKDQRTSPRRDRNRNVERRKDRRDSAKKHHPGHSTDRSQKARFSRRDDSSPSLERRPQANHQQRTHFPIIPLDVRVLPDQSALGNIMRRIRSSGQAHALRDIAALFLDHANACFLRLAPKKNESCPLFQCKACGVPALSETEIISHIIQNHLDDYYTAEAVQCPPPAGIFTSVARCDLNDEWVGPPNHHSYRARIHELLQQYPTKSESELLNHIKLLHDPESIEAWRAASTHKTVYKKKVQQDQSITDTQQLETENKQDTSEPVQKQPTLDRENAELEFRRTILPSLILTPNQLTCSVQAALKSPTNHLKRFFERILANEKRFPRSLHFALRGAFHHRKFHNFRVEGADKEEFIIFHRPTLFDPTNAVQEIKDALAYVAEHPCCTRHDLMQALVPDGDETRAKQVAGHVAFLIEKCHIIEYYNGLLVLPTATPPFKRTAHELTQHLAKRAPITKAKSKDSDQVASSPTAPEEQHSEEAQTTPCNEAVAPTQSSEASGDINSATTEQTNATE